MLRFVNHRLDWFLDHSRRLLSSSNVPATQNYHRYNPGIASQNSTPVIVSRHEVTSLVPNQTYKETEVRWQICLAKNVENNLTTYHHLIHYKDFYDRYLLRLSQLCEALDCLSASDTNHKGLQSANHIHEYLTTDSSYDRITKIYDVEDIIKSLNEDFELGKANLCLPTTEQHFLWRDLCCEENALKILSRNTLASSLHPVGLHNFPLQNFSVQENFFEQLTHTQFSQPQTPGNDDQKENKGPTQDQLNAIQDHLVEHFPKFISDKVDYSIYTDDVEFVVNWYPEKSYSTKGTVNYAIEVVRLRLFIHLRLARVNMTLLKVTNHIEDGSIKVRWRIIGLPHSMALWNYFSSNNHDGTTDAEWIDGLSTFYLNSKGFVYKHVLDRIVSETEKGAKVKPSMIQKLGLRIRLPLPT